MQQQVRRVISLGLKAGGAWLVHLGIFAGLLWLSARMQERHSAAEKPMESARAREPDSPIKHPEQAESVREDPFPDLPLTGDDPLCPSLGDDVIPYRGAGMTRPVLISGDPLQYPPEVLEAHPQGLIIARCTLTCRGEVTDCRIIKGLPFMDQAALTMLESRRYVPVQYQGRPITVSYVFPVRIP
jgi:protein TonB